MKFPRRIPAANAFVAAFLLFALFLPTPAGAIGGPRPVTVTVDALAGASLPAKVKVISPQAEKDQNGIRSFKVEISLEKIDPRLKPGMTARVDGMLESRKGVLKIPLSAVFEEGGKEIAFVTDPAGKPKRTVLKLGLRNETDAEVLTGLKEGEKLLTEKPADASKS